MSNGVESRPSQFAQRYEALMGRWSRRMASQFLTWLSPEPHLRWLDVGCGTGALASCVLELAAPSVIWGIDSEPQYIRRALDALRDERCRIRLGDALHLPPEIGSVDAAVSALFLNLIPNPAAALQEMIRVTRPGGRIATYVWDFAGGMQLTRHFWDAAIELDPAAVAFDQGRRYPLCHPDRLRDLFDSAGLASIRLQTLEIPTVFANFDDYWMPIEAGHGRPSEYLETLTPADGRRLREHLRASLPTRPNGSIPLTARAWAIDSQRTG